MYFLPLRINSVPLPLFLAYGPIYLAVHHNRDTDLPFTTYHHLCIFRNRFRAINKGLHTFTTHRHLSLLVVERPEYQLVQFPHYPSKIAKPLLLHHPSHVLGRS